MVHNGKVLLGFCWVFVGSYLSAFKLNTSADQSERFSEILDVLDEY